MDGGWVPPALPFSVLRAAQAGPPERPGPPQRAPLTPGAKVSPGRWRREGPSLAGHPAWALGWGCGRLSTQRKTLPESPSEEPGRVGGALPSPTGCGLTSRVQPGAWRGRPLDEGLLRSVRGGSPRLPAGAPGGKGGLGPRAAFSVPGSDEAQVHHVSAPARGPPGLRTGVCVWRWPACPPHHLSPLCTHLNNCTHNLTAPPRRALTPLCPRVSLCPGCPPHRVPVRSSALSAG